jgi:carboxyl-terminal processing protease
VRKVIEGSPAKRSGILKGDQLISINSQPVKDMSQARVYELLRGEIGDRTTIIVKRDEEEKKFRLLRREITVATVSTRVIDGIKPIAVIGINKFAKGACPKVKEAIEIAQRANVRGLLLDLRDNPGGQMEEAACVTSLFVGPEKRIFEIRYLDNAKKAEAYYGGEEKATDLPLAILVNASSASAAEIVAGSLRDFGRGLLVGERTFGKGSFQEGEYWSQNKNIALFETKGFYYLPSGRSPQMKGLEPDVQVNFDRIDVVRESDQFVNPLKAPERKVHSIVKMYEESHCLQMDEGSVTEDAQLAKAKAVLFCASAIARAGL